MYAANQLAGTVTVIPAGAPSPSHTIDVGAGTHPHGVAAAPDGTVYVANIMTNEVAVIEPGGTAVARRIPVGKAPQEVLAAADGTVYVTNSLDDSVSVIPAGAAAATRTIAVGDDPSRMVERGDGSVVVVNRRGRSLTVLDGGQAAAVASPVTPGGEETGVDDGGGIPGDAVIAQGSFDVALPAVAAGAVYCSWLALLRWL